MEAGAGVGRMASAVAADATGETDGAPPGVLLVAALADEIFAANCARLGGPSLGSDAGADAVVDGNISAGLGASTDCTGDPTADGAGWAGSIDWVGF